MTLFTVQMAMWWFSIIKSVFKGPATIF